MIEPEATFYAVVDMRTGATLNCTKILRKAVNRSVAGTVTASGQTPRAAVAAASEARAKAISDRAELRLRQR